MTAPRDNYSHIISYSASPLLPLQQVVHYVHYVLRTLHGTQVSRGSNGAAPGMIAHFCHQGRACCQNQTVGGVCTSRSQTRCHQDQGFPIQAIKDAARSLHPLLAPASWLNPMVSQRCNYCTYAYEASRTTCLFSQASWPLENSAAAFLGRVSGQARRRPTAAYCETAVVGCRVTGPIGGSLVLVVMQGIITERCHVIS